METELIHWFTSTGRHIVRSKNILFFTFDAALTVDITRFNLYKDVICQLKFHRLNAWLRQHTVRTVGKARLLRKSQSLTNKLMKRVQIPSFFFFLFAPIWELAPTLEHRDDFSVS
jgi:hypothetical protein